MSPDHHQPYFLADCDRPRLKPNQDHHDIIFYLYVDKKGGCKICLIVDIGN